MHINVSIYNFIFYKCGRSTERLKSANETFCLPKFHQQYSFELSVSYIPVPILGSYKCNWVVSAWNKLVTQMQ